MSYGETSFQSLVLEAYHVRYDAIVQLAVLKCPLINTLQQRTSFVLICFQFFAAPAFLRKVPHNTTKAKRAKNGTQFLKKFSSHLVGSENAILSRLKCKHFMNSLLSALSVLQKSPHLVGSENTILSGSDTKLFHFCMVEQNSRAIFVNSSK